MTVSSPHDTETRYADAVRVRSADGNTVYGTLELTHDHATEQPFTRTVTGLEIPTPPRSPPSSSRATTSSAGGAEAR